MFKITTHIAKIRKQQSTQLEEVCSLLKWSEEQYCWHQYEQYERFIHVNCGTMIYLRRELRYSNLFRGFWNNAWAKRNEVEFLPFAYECKYDSDYLLEEYLHINSYERLLHNTEFMNEYDQILKLI